MKLKPELESLRVINLNKCLCAPQLQGNIHMRPKCVLHMFQTHPACFMDASCASSGCVPHLAKGQLHKSCCSFIVKFTLAKCILCAFRMRFMHVLHASCIHFRCISHTFQTRVNVTLELSCTVYYAAWYNL